MALKLMYITNNPEVALLVEKVGIDRVFIDLEYIGKDLRQGGMDTVQSKHSVEDIAKIKKVVSKSEVLVRCNPIHEETSEYSSSAVEIEEIIKNGADIIMLPYFKHMNEVVQFLEYVNHRVKTMLLFETPESVKLVDQIMELDGIDEVFIGLNDLSLGYEKKFMFEVLADGTVEALCQKFKKNKVIYGFGGIAALGKGMLPAERIIAEHYRLGSNSVILSRSFCDLRKHKQIEEIDKIITEETALVRNYENYCVKQNEEFFSNNQKTLVKMVEDIVKINK